jgi:hypothetical protein
MLNIVDVLLLVYMYSRGVQITKHLAHNLVDLLTLPVFTAE